MKCDLGGRIRVERHTVEVITGIAGCCARAASGHVAAPPSNVMNSRRCISSPKLKGDGILTPQTSALIGAETGIKTIAAVHSHCRRWVISVESSRGRPSMHFRCSPKS